MFFDFTLLHRRHKKHIGKAWIAATMGIKSLTKHEIEQVNITDLCVQLEKFISTDSACARKRFSLRLSSILIFGVVKIHQRQVIILQDATFNAIVKVHRPLAVKTTFLEDSGEISLPSTPKVKVRSTRPQRKLQEIIKDVEPEIIQPATVVPVDTITIRDTARTLETLDEYPLEKSGLEEIESFLPRPRITPLSSTSKSTPPETPLPPITIEAMVHAPAGEYIEEPRMLSGSLREPPITSERSLAVEQPLDAEQRLPEEQAIAPEESVSKSARTRRTPSKKRSAIDNEVHEPPLPLIIIEAMVHAPAGEYIGEPRILPESSKEPPVTSERSSTAEQTEPPEQAIAVEQPITVQDHLILEQPIAPEQPVSKNAITSRTPSKKRPAFDNEVHEDRREIINDEGRKRQRTENNRKRELALKNLLAKPVSRVVKINRCSERDCEFDYEDDKLDLKFTTFSFINFEDLLKKFWYDDDIVPQRREISRDDSSVHGLTSITKNRSTLEKDLTLSIPHITLENLSTPPADVSKKLSADNVTAPSPSRQRRTITETTPIPAVAINEQQIPFAEQTVIGQQQITVGEETIIGKQRTITETTPIPVLAINQQQLTFAEETVIGQQQEILNEGISIPDLPANKEQLTVPSEVYSERDINARLEKIVHKIAAWNYDNGAPTPEDLVEKPFKKLKMARLFSDSLVLSMKKVVILKPQEGSLELETYEKGPNFDAFLSSISV